MKTKYHWMSNVTGEIVCNFIDVIKTIIFDYVDYGVKNFSWQYSHKGF